MRSGKAELFFTFVLFVLFLITAIIIDYTGNEDKIIHIKKVTDVSNASSGLEYKVFTDEGVYVNSDRFLIGKFNSSDLQNELIGKKVCKVHLIGHRIPFLSTYKNITKIYWCK